MLNNDKNQPLASPGRQGLLPGFTSYKTVAPITFRGRWPRDALIQATLDPTVDRILPWSGQPVAAPDLAASFVRVIDGRTVLTLLTEVHEATHVAPGAFDTIALLTKREIQAEPRLTACRSIWSLRARHVPAQLIVQIIQTLAENGRVLPLQTVAQACPARDANAIESVLTLACSGLLQVWAGDGLTRNTPVSLSQNLC